MEHYETEEQQIEAIKRFWKENGTALVLGAVLGLGGLWGWRYYNDTQTTAREMASDSYQQSIDALAQGETGFTQAVNFVEQNPGNSYALLTSMRLAKEAVERKDMAEAAKQLSWVMANTDNVSIKAVAAIRLARVQLEQGELETALASITAVNDDAFSAKVEEVKGDIYHKQGKIDKARAAYSAAMEKNANNNLLKMKLDNLASANA